ncbi:MAG: ABC transporter permease [bacterium]|nr:ABC transporter permease [bacterium]
MFAYIRRRIIHMIPLLIGITFFSFLIIQMAPGDFFDQLKLNPQISRVTLEKMRQEFGLDKPWVVQYFHWLKNILKLDFGYSFTYHVPVFDLVKERAWNTFVLAFLSMIFIWLLAIPMGVVSAVKKNTISDKLLSILAFLGMSIPSFFLAFIFIFIAAKTGWLPIGGVVSLDHDNLSVFGKTIDYLRHIIIPISVLVVGGLAGLMRLMRANMLEVLRSQYITTARAKGLPEYLVVYKHALRNAINPLVTIFGYEISGLLSGAALIETVTSWPGLGRLMLDAVFSQDLYLVMGSLVMSAVLLLIGNLIADILLLIVDPRIRQ